MAVKKSFSKMACTGCKTTNYFTKKSKLTADKKLELSKFCKKCKKHTKHREAKRQVSK